MVHEPNLTVFVYARNLGYSANLMIGETEVFKDSTSGAVSSE